MTEYITKEQADDQLREVVKDLQSLINTMPMGTVKCQECDAEFKMPMDYIKDGHERYCSEKCRPPLQQYRRREKPRD